MKSLSNKIGTAFTIGGLIYGIGSLDADAQSKSNVYPTQHISNIDFQKLNNGKPLGTTEIGLWENLMRGYMHEFPEHAENQENFMFLPHDSVTVWKGYGKKANNELEFNTYYAFEKVKDGKEFADEFTFAVGGKHALKITRDLGKLCNGQALEEGIKRGYSKDGYTVETVYELGGVLKVIRINDEYFLYPYKEDAEFEEIKKSIKDGKTPEKTPGYLIKLDKNTQIGVENKTGAIKVRSPNNIYEGVMYFTGEEPIRRETNSTGGQAGKKPVASKTDSTKVKSIKIKDSKDKGNLYWVAGPNASINSLGLDLGIGYGPVALVGHLGGSKDENLINYDGIKSPSTGREYLTTKDNLNIIKLGLSGEFRFLRDKFISPFIFGGTNMIIYNQASQEEGIKNSLLKKEFSGTAGGGFSFGKNNKVDIYAAWDSRKVPELNNPKPKNSLKQLSIGVRAVKNFGRKK